MRLGSTRRQYQSDVATSLAIAALTFASYQLHFNAATVVLLYLLVIVWQSLAGGFLASAIIAVAAAGCLDFFFLPPILSFQISDRFNVLALFVFLVSALVVTRLVSQVGVEAQRAERHSVEVEQLYEVARRLLLLTPDQVGGIAALQVFREVMGAAAVCLLDGSTSEIGIDGTSRHDLPERTRGAYILDKDTDDVACAVSVRCLRIGSEMTGAIGFEGLPDAKTILPAFVVLAAAALDRAASFRRASHQSAAAQVEVFRTAILDALAHEFKTPLATILAVIGGIREARSLEPEHREMAGMIETEILRLSRLTTRLLRTARLEQEELKPQLTSLDVVPFVERVVHRYRHHSREHRIVTTAYCTSVETPADPQLLDLALTQLLDNAFKYSLPASAIMVSVHAEHGFVTTSVKNEGTSIAPEEEIRIFERFYRGARVRNLVSGTGLGLYVARKIAAAHGGSLSLINDVPGKGVAFCLKLPMIHHGGHNLPASS